MPKTWIVGRRLTALLDRLRHRAQPTSWALLFGTVSLGCFTVLLITGVILMVVYDGSGELITYDGSYALLQGITVSRAFASTMELSFEVPGGLLVRQAHHWAALVLPASMLMQLAGAFFTGATRRPRHWAWVLLVAAFLVVLVCGWSGYALPDDNLSGTGLRIVQGTTLALPFIGTWFTGLLFGGEFPGRVIEHLYLIHLITPVVLVLIGALRLWLGGRRGPVQPPDGRAPDPVVGLPVWPQVAVRAGGLFMITLGVLVIMAGTMTVSPVWRYGPASPGNAYAGSQPDWYTAFLDGALRLVPPGWEVFLWGRTWSFAVLVPLAAIGAFFTLLLAWPFVEERLTGRTERPLPQRPRDHPNRTGFGAAGVTFYGVLWLSGSADLLATQFHLSFEGVIRVFRILVLIGPFLAFAVTRAVCLGLQTADRERQQHGAETGQLVRLVNGGYVERHDPAPAARTEPAALDASGRQRNTTDAAPSPPLADAARR
jgi:ubiquinol-cytochrome c reductase cytochrome b subunit